MLLCVNPNAAIDKTAVVENFRLNAIHRPSLELALPGGKGCNVARAAKTLGLQPVVTGWVGGHAGSFIEEGLKAEGILTAFVHTAVESRTCLSVLDPIQGTITEIYEKGRPVSESELEQFGAIYDEWLTRVQIITLSGSLPPGVPADFYASLIGKARERKVPVILDSSGEPLRAGLEEGRPYMVKCNRAELSGLIGDRLEGLEDTRRAVAELSGRWKTNFVITLGGAGAIALAGGKWWLAQAPQVQAVSAVGSGDSFLAGLACGLVSGRPIEQALRLAVSAGSANTLIIGAGRLRAADVDTLQNQVRMAEQFL